MIALPWERRGGLLRRLGLSRARPLLLTLSVILLFVLIGVREHRAAGVRATRASALTVRRAVDAYRADHGGKCPAELSELEKKGYVPKVPTDAWGNSFILTCPGRFEKDGYELLSAGPDGEPGGLDRVE
jgi:hypothetical protein